MNINNASGYFVRLTEDRRETLDKNISFFFAEPVPEFPHKRSAPLICFILDQEENITHIALGKKGIRAGTDLRRLNMKPIKRLKFPIHINEVINGIPKSYSTRIREKSKNGGLLPPRTFDHLIENVMHLYPETKKMLLLFSASRMDRISNLDIRRSQRLAEQKEAVATAMTISGIDRDELRGWDYNEDEDVGSFLDGLEKVRLREDPMIVNDLSNVPGYELVKRFQHTTTVFQNNSNKLTVVLANKLPLEEQLGVDLIYFNENYSCFVMVQYKAMEDENGEAVFRIPKEGGVKKSQLQVEIERMEHVVNEMSSLSDNKQINGFRLNQNPFFIKLCPRLSFSPDNIGLIKGMYIPLDYWKLLDKDERIKGKKGGKRVTFSNVGRYFNNTEFIHIVSGAWVGTNIEQSEQLEIAIRSTLESGKSVVFAIASKH